MVENKISAIGMLCSLGLAVLANGYGSDAMVGLAGLGILIFGIWSSIILLRKENE